MRRLFVLALPALVGLAAAARAGDGDGKCKTRYLVPPPADNPSCPCPCDKRMSLCVMGRDHAHKYVDKLSCDQPCCARIKAVKKLGNRLCADFCKDPDVLNALLDALYFDSCWKVRRAAAWSIFGQRAFSDEALLALYISSKLDPHYLVRVRAAEALDLLTLCRKCCYKGIYEYGDEFIKELRKAKFVPGSKDARDAYALGAVGPAAPGTVIEVVPSPEEKKPLPPGPKKEGTPKAVVAPEPIAQPALAMPSAK
jgi:hypothetical protein